MKIKTWNAIIINASTSCLLCSASMCRQSIEHHSLWFHSIQPLIVKVTIKEWEYAKFDRNRMLLYSVLMLRKYIEHLHFQLNFLQYLVAWVTIEKKLDNYKKYKSIQTLLYFNTSPRCWAPTTPIWFHRTSTFVSVYQVSNEIKVGENEILLYYDTMHCWETEHLHLPVCCCTDLTLEVSIKNDKFQQYMWIRDKQVTIFCSNALLRNWAPAIPI